jgi:hypothetical protein
MPGEVFLSHSAEDHSFAEELVGLMTAHGVPVWYSPRNIVGAQQWHDEIGAALRRCDWFVLLLSPSAVASKWVKREVLYALQDDRYENHIVPVVHIPCDHAKLSWTLSGFQMVDFRPSFEDGCRALLRVWGLGYRNAPE